MGNYSNVYLGRILVREDLSVDEKSNGALTLTGQESMPNVSKLDVERRREDLLGMQGELLPVYFSEKNALDGFYSVDDTSTTLTEWDSALAIAAWTANLVRVGRSNEIDLESRLSGSLTRVNDFSATGVRWHSPAVNHKAYWAGNTAPLFASRTGSDGVLKVYRSIPVTVNPRWGCTVQDYKLGRVRFIDADDYERHGKSIVVNPADWELSNSLLRIKPLSSGGTLEISAWTGSTWAAKNWDILHEVGPAVSMGVADYASIIWNTYECVIVRLMKSVGTVGRMSVDITLRRGASFAEVYVQHEYGTTLKIVRATAEAGTAGTGYVAATSVDANGFRYFVGSARSFTGDNVNGGISKTATATLDAAVGVAFDAASGNAAADLYQQYLGSPSEYVQAVRR